MTEGAAAMEFQDYYKTLGVPRTATPAEIKKAYRKLARESHPDARPGDTKAEQRFKAINEANAVLTDADKRKRYDALGKDWDRYTTGPDAPRTGAGGDPFGPGGPFAGYAAGRGAGGGGVRYEFHTSGGESAGFSDFFRMVFGGGAAAETGGRGRAGTATAAGGQSIEDLLASMSAGGRSAAGSATGSAAGARTARPRAVEAHAELSLEEAYHGTSRIVEVGGKRLEVTVPRGVDTGSRIKLSGKGGAGRDLVVVTRVRPHPVFTRRGPDLEREVPISLREALLGSEVPVATLKGRVLLSVPAATQAGRTFRLTGQGMPRFNATGSGDLYVRVRVILPTALDDEARAAAAAFLDLVDQPDPRAG